MRLSEIFAGEKQAAEAAGTKQSNAAQNTSLVNRQIRSLAPGQTIQGELVARNGSEVQIKLSEDLTIKARLEQNMNLEVGKNITFEVKNNGQSLVLNPLYTNVATDANVLKALDMAALPVNHDTIEMTEALMKAGLSIDKNSLLQVFRECNQFANADIADIVDLHKLSMPVNENNLAQISSYKNLTHQLVAGLNDCMETLPDTIQNMLQAGDIIGAEKLYQELLSMIQGGASTALTEDGLTAALSGQNPTLIQTADGQLLVLELSGEREGQIFDFPGDGKLLQTLLQPENGALLQALARDGDSALLLALVQGGDSALLQALARDGDSTMLQALSQNGDSVFTQALMNMAGGTLKEAASMGDSQLLQTLLQGMDSQALQGLLQSGDNELLQLLAQTSPEGKQGASLTPLSDYLKENLQKQWTLKPEQVGDAKQVEQLYSRLERQLKSLNQVLESVHQTGSEAYKATARLTQNLDFLQQLNQAYTFVQLPLRLQQGYNAHGELFVYTNKKHLAAKDGQISALLHLDMEYLGPVDVYVAMQYEKVNTKFYLQDDEMLDFLESHIDLLTEHLQARGYNCSCEMVTRGAEEEQQGSSIQQMLQANGHVPMVQYAFDVRT